MCRLSTIEYLISTLSADIIYLITVVLPLNKMGLKHKTKKQTDSKQTDPSLLWFISNRRRVVARLLALRCVVFFFFLFFFFNVMDLSIIAKSGVAQATCQMLPGSKGHLAPQPS